MKKFLPFFFAGLSVFSSCKKENQNDFIRSERAKVELDLNNLGAFYKNARIEVANAHNKIVYATMSESQQELDNKTMKFSQQEWVEKTDSLYDLFVWADNKQNTELRTDKHYVLNALNVVDDVTKYKLQRLGFRVESSKTKGE